MLDSILMEIKHDQISLELNNWHLSSDHHLWVSVYIFKSHNGVVFETNAKHHVAFKATVSNCNLSFKDFLSIDDTIHAPLIDAMHNHVSFKCYKW